MGFLIFLFSLIALVSASASAAVANATIQCPKGFALVNDRCIRIFSNRLKHPDAEKDCIYLGGTLVNIRNSIDNRAIATRAANAGLNTIWIGAFCFSDNSADCYWDNGSGPVGNSSNFAPGYPKIEAGYGGCVSMTTANGQWYTANCQVIGMPFICEVPKSVADACPHNFNGNCYFPSTAKLSHDDAQSFCTNQSMNLVSIHSKMEHDFVKNMFGSGSNTTQILLGATSSLPSTFDWDDGSVWNFDYKDPLGPSGAENCMVMDVSGDGLWTEVPCQLEAFFVCERPAGASGAAGAQDQRLGAKRELQGSLISSNADASHCNSNLILAPGIITSPAYPKYGTPLLSCTYALRALGPYHIGIYFTDFSTNWNQVTVYDEFDNLIGSYLEDLKPFKLIAPTNIVKVMFSVSPYQNVQRGFTATFLPIS